MVYPAIRKIGQPAILSVLSGAPFSTTVNGLTNLLISGTPIAGNVLSVVNPTSIYYLMDDGELLFDDSQQLAFGAVEDAYQWYINGVAIEGANDIYFTLPDSVIVGDVVNVNNSLPLCVISIPFEVVSAQYRVSNRFITSEEDPEEILINDRVIARTTLSDVVSDYEFKPTVQGLTTSDAWTFISSDPLIATINSGTGFVTHVSDGVITITASIRDYSENFVLLCSTGTGQISDAFIEYEEGSAAQEATDAIDSRIATKFDPLNNLKLYTTQNHTTQIYVRNPNVWCADIDLTCISPWNSNGGATKAGTLISPRHILFAAHYEISNGATIRFITQDGTVVNRVMTSKLRHPEYIPYYPDITIGLLSSDVPETISFAKVLPDNWATKFPSISDISARIPAIGIDQEEKATIQDWAYHTNTSVSNAIPSDAKRLSLYENKIVGDSGNPEFIIINNEPVLLTVWTSGGPGGGTAIANQKTAINSMMTSLGGGYQLTEIDLSTFNTY